MKFILLFIFSCHVFFGFSQKKREKKLGKTSYITNATAKETGWYFGGGLNYTVPYLKQTTSTTINNNSIVTESVPRGKIGYSFSIGTFQIFKTKRINYLDIGLAYKKISGSEKFTTTTNASSPLSSTATFKDHIIAAQILFANRKEGKGNLTFINGLSPHINFVFSPNRSAANTLSTKDELLNSPTFYSQLNYHFGMGFQLNNRVIILPSLEVSIFSLFPFDPIQSTLSFFNSRYRPIFFSLKILLLKRQEDCPKARNNN